MPGTSPSGLNQTEIKCLAASPCKLIRRQLERRKSTNPPIRRCRSRSPGLCQRHQGLPDKRVGHVSFPTKRQKWCIIYYAGFIPTLAVEGLSKEAKEQSRYEEACKEVNTSGKLTLPRSTPLGCTPHSRIPHQNTRSHPRSSSLLSSAMWGPPAPIPTSQRPKPGSLTRGREEAQEEYN
jgi:hypothetical protein